MSVSYGEWMRINMGRTRSVKGREEREGSMVNRGGRGGGEGLLNSWTGGSSRRVRGLQRSEGKGGSVTSRCERC